MFESSKRVISRFIDVVLPPRCPVTGDVVEQQGQIASHAWGALHFIGQPQCQSCGVPFSHHSETELKCADCVYYPPEFDQARSALVYDEASRKLILEFKHGDQTQHALAFVPWLMRAGQSLIVDSDIVIPVPLHRMRLWRRRYNQAALIAKELSQAMSMPYRPDLLLRKKATASQGHLSPKQRTENVKRAFRVQEELTPMIKGKTVLLVDDVYTTGATVRECARVLKAAGAARVNVLTVARTVPEEL